jgi:glycosyltransferase involved in cell wall biosynthesis
MHKIKILVLPSDRSGVGKFRSVEPHIFLQNNYEDEFHVDIDYEPKLDDETYWKQYNIIHFHRSIGKIHTKSITKLKELKNQGIITIMDIDDYWLPGVEHPAHSIVKQNGINKNIVEHLKLVDYITTTTTIFADEIRKLNKNVFVLPNSINPKESQFNEPTIKSDKIRFGWLGGSSHLHDLKLLEGNFDRLSSVKDKFELYLCGFDTRGTITEINKNTGEQKQRPIKPEETVWAKYEEIFTSNYKFINDEYKNSLLKFKEDELPMNPSYYHRVWTKPVTSYAKNYSKFDVSLSPIKDTMFNRMKSQLKVIEAGFYKKAIIASEVGPYTIDLIHSVKNGNFVDGNALLVDKSRNHSDWAYYMKKLIDNPTWVEDLGERLYETVSKKYDLNIVTKTRAEIYKNLIK